MISKIDSAIQRVLYGVALDGLIQLSVTKFPFLGFPVVRTIYRAAVKWVIENLYDILYKNSVYLMVKLDTQEKRRAYEAATETLREALDNGHDHTLAEKEFDRRVRDLVSFRM